jgi:hypothetical protein
MALISSCGSSSNDQSTPQDTNCSEAYITDYKNVLNQATRSLISANVQQACDKWSRSIEDSEEFLNTYGNAGACKTAINGNLVTLSNLEVQTFQETVSRYYNRNCPAE